MRRILALTALLLFTLVPAAGAEWYPAEPLDGPAEIEKLGDIDLARDGTGGVVYIKRDGGVPQVFLSRITGGAWSAPEKVSSGAPVSEAAITAVDGGRLLIAWIADGQALGTVIPQAGAAAAPAATLGGPGATGVSVDMGINQVGYAVWTASGDIRAARLEGTAWTPIPTALDIDPARDASRPRVAVSAEGNGVVVWGEDHADGTSHVYSRRLTGVTPSFAPQDLTLGTFEGGAGASADSPDIDIEDDGSYAWVAFRQIIGGRSRSIARRLRGSEYEAPFAIDSGQASGDPRIDFAGKGIGASVAGGADNAILSAYLDKFDAFQPAVRVDQPPGGAPPAPVVATSERGDAYVAWRTAAGEVRSRRKNGEEGFEPEFIASNPVYGPVEAVQVGIGSDRSGNTAVAMLQGGAGGRRLTVSVYDRLPGRPVVLSSIRYRARKPLIKWAVGSENWGVQTFTVVVDGKAIGQTTKNRLTSPRALRKGTHRYYVRATDRRGQVSTSRTRTFRVDSGLPSLRLTVRRSGRLVRVSAVARDRGPAGMDYVSVDWGDRSRKQRGSRRSHRYKKGRYTLTVRAVDKAGNVTAKKKVLRIP